MPGRPAKPLFPRAAALDDCALGAFSIKRAAKFCSLCAEEIERAIQRGEIETFRRGRRVLMTKKAVIAWLAKLLEAERTQTRRSGA